MGRKPRTQTRENVYLMTMVSRNPRQIVGHDVAFDKSPKRIQAMVDGVPPAEKYCSDGYLGYVDVAYYGEHIRNICDKKDTFTVEGVNADLRHYIPLLARRSRCFARSLETLKAVLAVFVEAYNKFGVAKQRFTERYGRRELPFSLLDYF
jgi:IS1 family transposase